MQNMVPCTRRLNNTQAIPNWKLMSATSALAQIRILQQYYPSNKRFTTRLLHANFRKFRLACSEYCDNVPDDSPEVGDHSPDAGSIRRLCGDHSSDAAKRAGPRPRFALAGFVICLQRQMLALGVALLS